MERWSSWNGVMRIVLSMLWSSSCGDERLPSESADGRCGRSRWDWASGYVVGRSPPRRGECATISGSSGAGRGIFSRSAHHLRRRLADGAMSRVAVGIAFSGGVDSFYTLRPHLAETEPYPPCRVCTA